MKSWVEWQPIEEHSTLIYLSCGRYFLQTRKTTQKRFDVTDIVAIIKENDII